MIKEQISRWEHELWHYVSTGDGDSCPVSGQCQARLKGGWSNGSECSCQNLDCLPAKPSNPDFIEGMRPGRIFELVEKLAQRYLKIGKIKTIPIPSSLINLVDPQRSIEIRPVPLKAYHGAIWRLNDSWIIHINCNDSYTKQRLTLFHEAFHILAHCRATPVFKKMGREKGSFNELLAENFAYHVLMPRQQVKEKWKQIQDPHLMAEFFQVPRNSMQMRLNAMGLL